MINLVIGIFMGFGVTMASVLIDRNLKKEKKPFTGTENEWREVFNEITKPKETSYRYDGKPQAQIIKKEELNDEILDEITK